jgi:hypothetical protein
LCTLTHTGIVAQYWCFLSNEPITGAQTLTIQSPTFCPVYGYNLGGTR